MSLEAPSPLSGTRLALGAALALLSAVLGFWLTWGGVDSRGNRLEVPAADRRLAESGRVARPESTIPRLGTWTRDRKTYVPHPRTRLELPPEPGLGAPAPLPPPSAGPGLETVPYPGSAPEPPHPAPSPRSLPLPGPGHPLGQHPGGRHAPARPADRQAPALPGLEGGAARPPGSQGLPYPAPDDRGPERSLAEAWELAEPSCGLVLDPDGIPRGSITALTGGLAVASRSILMGVPSATLAASFQLVEAVAEDPARDLVTLGTQGAWGLKLAPEPPRPGLELAAAPGFVAEGTWQPCVVTENLGDGLFLFRGPALPSSAGAALVNSRAELVGVVLGNLPGYPGHGSVLAADSSILQALAAPGAALRDGPAEGFLRVRDRLARAVAPVPPDSPRGSNSRVVPGVSLGPYRLGTSRPELQKALGPGLLLGTGGEFQLLSYRAYHLEFTLLEDRVVAMATTDPFYATSRGVGVGTPWAGVRADAELAEVRVGRLPGGRQLAVSPGLEMEIAGTGKVQRLVVLPR